MKKKRDAARKKAKYIPKKRKKDSSLPPSSVIEDSKSLDSTEEISEIEKIRLKNIEELQKRITEKFGQNSKYTFNAK